MDFALSADQVALRDAANELLDGRSSIAVVRAAMDRGGLPDAQLWSAMVEQGWCGIAVPESLDGIGLGWVEAALLIEAAGAHVSPAPILSQLVALDVMADTPWREGLLSGEVTAAITDDLDAPVPYAPSADVIVAIEADELVAIELAAPPAVEAAMDLTRPLGFVRGARSSSTVVGDADAVTRFRDLGSIAYAAELLGMAQRCLDMSVAYAGERVQFGKPIGSFQAIKHRCADMLVDVEGMRSVVWWAAWCASARHDDVSVAASTAKIWCSDAATRVLLGAMQVHGGIGFTWEHDLHLYLKRTHLDALAFGSATWHRQRLAAILRDRVAAGGSVI